MKTIKRPSNRHFLYPGVLLLSFLFLIQVSFHAQAQEKTVIPIFIVVPGINDLGDGLIDLVSPWAYGQEDSPPPAWTLGTDHPATLQAEDLRFVFERGVRVINVDMDIGIFSPTGSFQQEWREQTALASDLLQNLTQGIQSLNEASDSVEYRAVVLAHSAGTVAVADSWQEGAVYDKAILLSPRFRVDIMANLARSAGLNANDLLVVTADGDYLRSIFQPEPEVRPENHFFPHSKAGYGHPDFAGISYTHLHITGWDSFWLNDPHTAMIRHAHDEYAWLTGAEGSVLLAQIYQEFIESNPPNQETDIPTSDG